MNKVENNRIYITKANGERELFDNRKLKNSLQRAGASPKAIATVANRIVAEIKDGMSTAEIYRRAFDLLNRFEKGTASRYSLRRAVMELGPSGFPFEHFVGAIFKAMGFAVCVGRTIKGLCVAHEIDIIARDNQRFIMGEVKFHNKQGIKSDLKVVLYVKERFDDIEKGEFYRNIDQDLKKEKWLITNTKFTTKAIHYGQCGAGMILVSWNYPEQGNLYQLIEKAGLYPLTCLETLNQYDKKLFLNKNIVLCRDLTKGGERLFNLAGISAQKRKKVLKEIGGLIGEYKL